MAKERTKPYPDPMANPKQAAFLAAYAKLGNITAAAAASGCDPSNHRVTWKKNPRYMEAFKEAHKQAVELMEAEAIRRATRGTDEPVFHKGKPCGSIRRYSDTLLIFLLKAAKPKKYRERVDMTHGGTIRHVKLYGQEAPVSDV